MGYKFHIYSLDNLIGADFEEAAAGLHFCGLKLRRVKIDGEPQLITMDLRGDRINVEVEDGKITAIRSVE